MVNYEYWYASYQTCFKKSEKNRYLMDSAIQISYNRPLESVVLKMDRVIHLADSDCRRKT